MLLLINGTGKVLDEAKMSQYDWERRDEEHINVPKCVFACTHAATLVTLAVLLALTYVCAACRFLVEIINETPIQVSGGASTSVAPAYSSNTVAAAPSAAPAPPRVAPSKFRAPVAAGSNTGPPRMGMRPGAGARQPLRRYNDPQPAPFPFQPQQQTQQPSQTQQQPQQQQRSVPVTPAIAIDFDRHPTSEWTYVPNAINRSGTSLLQLLRAGWICSGCDGAFHTRAVAHVYLYVLL